MKTRLFSTFGTTFALLVPALASAQPQDPPPVPDAAPNPPPIDPGTSPEQPPVVIVNPPPAPPPVIDTAPEYETYRAAWNAPMFTSGALIFLGSYGASVVVAATSEGDDIDRGNDRLYVPVVGPWLALDDRPDCPVEDEDCDLETTKKVLLVADGILQAGGVVTMIAGLLSPTEYRVVRRPIVSKKVNVAPSAAGGSLGIRVFGRF